MLASEPYDVYRLGPAAKRIVTFMRLIEKTFGKEVTTRTWDTIAKVARG